MLVHLANCAKRKITGKFKNKNKLLINPVNDKKIYCLKHIFLI